jgi:hypothetical protein
LAGFKPNELIGVGLEEVRSMVIELLGLFFHVLKDVVVLLLLFVWVVGGGLHGFWSEVDGSIR